MRTPQQTPIYGHMMNLTTGKVKIWGYKQLYNSPEKIQI